MLAKKIANRDAVVAILGLGYVGFPLACLFTRVGFRVIGYDTDEGRLKAIDENKVHWSDYRAPRRDLLTLTSKAADLAAADIFIITVQTPLKVNNTPDLSYIESAAHAISQNLAPGKLVVLESTTYPGTSEEVLLPILEKSGLSAGKDFYLAFSPERIDPGNAKWRVEDIPKIVGGFNEESRGLASSFYSTIIKKTVPVSSLRTAEAVKLMENIFRNVNIALVNELAKIFDKLGMDTWEIINAAATKPFCFMPHFPGPGVGGHCIPKDPLYLAYRAKKEGLDVRFIELAANINYSMPFYVLHIVANSLARAGKDMRKSKIAVLGVTYKKDVPDLRDTPSRICIEELQKSANEVVVFDPVSEECFGATRGPNLADTIAGKDCILVLVDHTEFRVQKIEELINSLAPNACIVDAKNFIDAKLLSPTVHYKCLGRAHKLHRT